MYGITPQVPHFLHVVIPVLTMTMNSKISDSLSIFEDGKLNPRIYKIQNLHGQTYIDFHEHRSRQVCCRPATVLAEGRGIVRPFCSLWFVYLTIAGGKLSLLGLDTPYRE